MNAIYSNTKISQPSVYIAPDGHVWGMIRTNPVRKRGPKERYMFWSFPPPWQLFVHTVSLRQPDTVSHVRSAYQDMRQDFITRAKTLVSRDTWKRQEMYKWQVHHVIPVALGGGNDFLALIRPEPHAHVHRFLDAQTLGMVPYETRTILIPVCRGIIWNLSPSIKRSDRPVLPARKNTMHHPFPRHLEIHV